MQRQYRFILFPLGIFGLFKTDRLIEAIRRGCEGGYRLLRREFTIEPRRVLLFLKTLAFGLVFERDESAPAADHDWKIVCYKTRLMTKTVNPTHLERVLASGSEGGYELYHAMKYPARFLLIFPREAYFFIFRRPVVAKATIPVYEYAVQQTPYRFFSRTLDENVYTDQLNTYAHGGNLKITFRDERRVLGAFAQPTVVAIWERPNGHRPQVGMTA